MAEHKSGSLFNLSLNDRLQTMIKLSSVIADSSLSMSSKDAMTQAKALETRFFNESSSMSEYLGRCEEWVDSLSSKTNSKNNGGNQSNAEDDLNTIASRVISSCKAPISIGRYKKCAWWRDGYSSAVYVCRALDDTISDFSGPPGAAVAIKTVATSLLQAPHDAQREIRIMTSARSAHVLELWEHFVDPQAQLVLVFPFMPMTLADIIASSKQLNINDTKRCLKDMFRGLAHIHSIGIIHRDIKPSNVLLASSHGPGYITDFGIAWSSNDHTEKPDDKITDVGTTSYRAPELLFGYRAYGTELDMYAAGVTTAETMCQLKNHLFEGGGRGTDLGLLNSILLALGTPTEEAWPELNHMPDWGKLQFKDYPPKSWKELLPGGDEKTIDLVDKLVRYSAHQRLTAVEALKQAFFEDVE